MELVKMISELRSERAAIDEALMVLERLMLSTGKRRGRPPAWLAMATASAGESRSNMRGVLSPEAKQRMSEAQKRRWAAYRKAKKPA